MSAIALGSNDLLVRESPKKNVFKHWKCHPNSAFSLVGALVALIVLVVTTFYLYSTTNEWLESYYEHTKSTSYLEATVGSTVSEPYGFSRRPTKLSRGSASTSALTSQGISFPFVKQALQEHDRNENIGNGSAHVRHDADGRLAQNISRQNIKLPRQDGPYNDEWWNTLIDKGQCLLTQLQWRSIPDSIFTKYGDIAAGGWKGQREPHTNLIWDKSLVGMMNQYGWNSDDFQRYLHDKEPVGNTFNMYDVLVNPVAGVIVATNVWAPRGGDPNLLSRLSDYMFLVYQQACATAPQRLKMDACLSGLTWIIHEVIINRDTNMAVQRATNGDGQSYPPFPGTLLSMAEPRAAGVLASPNGVGAAYVCGQRKNTAMGQKIPDTVNIFGSGGGGGLCLAFHLSDYVPGMFAQGGGQGSGQGGGEGSGQGGGEGSGQGSGQGGGEGSGQGGQQGGQ